MKRGSAISDAVDLRPLDDPGVAAIGEIVRDIDLKDGKFAPAEAGAIAAVIDGLDVRAWRMWRASSRAAACSTTLCAVQRSAPIGSHDRRADPAARPSCSQR